MVACVLIPDSAFADPVEAAELTERVLRELEGIGAAVESERTGEAFFAVDGLRGIYGGKAAGVLSAARRAVGAEARMGSGPTRFAAWFAASERRHPVGVSALCERIGLPAREAGDLRETMRRLGIETLEDLAALSPARIADRFGPAGLAALRLAHGEEEPLRPLELSATRRGSQRPQLRATTVSQRTRRVLALGRGGGSAWRLACRPRSGRPRS